MPQNLKQNRRSITALAENPDSSFTIQKINKPDQLLPYFVMETATIMPGLPGIFLSGVFSAALSTMSTGLNSMTGVIFEDIIQPFYGQMSDKAASFTLKFVVVIIGVLCVGMVFVVERLGTLLQMTKTLLGITNGPLLGLFTLGMFFPTSNHYGAMAGGVTSLCIMSWISLGAQTAISRGQITFPTKPVNVSGCKEFISDAASSPTLPTLLSFESTMESEALYIFRVSYQWYAAMGTCITIMVGLLVSHFTPTTEQVSKELLSPVIYGFLKRSRPVSEIKNLTEDANGVELTAATQTPNEDKKGGGKWL